MSMDGWTCWSTAPRSTQNSTRKPWRAVIPAGSFEDYPLDAWRQALDVNLTGMFLCCQAAVKPMILQGKKGSIINICSTYGLVAPDQRLYQRNGIQTAYKPVFYSVTKAGVLGMTRYLAAYYAGTEPARQRTHPRRSVQQPR